MDVQKKRIYIVRPVKRTDSKRIWEIRNHPDVRQNAHNAESFSFESHDMWFSKKYFGDVENVCFILTDEGGHVIGYCRLDVGDEKNKYIVSIALDPSKQGKGLGQYLLSHSLKLSEDKKDMIAEIQKNNVSSLTLFQNNKFVIFREDIENYYLILIQT